MANSAGMLKESIWRDKDWRLLPRTAQATYVQLISQKELDRAGIQPLQVAKWAKGCNDLTAEDLCADLKVLEQHRFVFVDEDTDELFVRSYMRHCDVARYPNILKNALRCARMVASEKLRHELAKELRRLHKADADQVADAIDPPGFEPDFDEPQLNGSETLPNPSETLPQTVPATVPERLNGSETPTEPQGYGSGYGSVTLGSSQVGGAREREPNADNEPPPDSNDPPPRHCPKHMPGGTLDPCGACKEHRQRHDRWLANADIEQKRAQQAAAREEASRRAQLAVDRQLAITDCDLCDDNGYRGAHVCDHIDRTETTKAGIAAVRAALAKGSAK
ncbi:hypothetical protein [Mycobacterium branderi]|uniref:hypothetical protein n=1 Tax=Mycobacterium branderi TaxID=43348 RepID=UPI0009F433C3|nr:hypothetical protein [Mycobacterium branderi]